MGKLTSSCALIAILVGGFAQAENAHDYELQQDIDQSGFAPFAGSSRGQMEGVVACVRNILEHKLGGTDGVRRAAVYLSSAQENADTGAAALQTVRQRCEDEARGMRPSDISREIQYGRINHIQGLTPNVSRILVDLIRPTVVCKRAKASLDGAPIWLAGMMAGSASVVGGHIALQGALCNASNGRSWFEVSAGANITEGIILTADIILGSQSRITWVDTLDKFHDTSESVHRSAAVLVGESQDQTWKNDTLQETPQQNDGNAAGVAIGLGIHQSWTTMHDHKVAVFPTNNKPLADELMKGLPWGKPRKL